MQHSGQPSRTALLAASHRAAHQVLEQGRLFRDPLAVPIIGGDADALRRAAEADPGSRRMRLFIAARTRFAEDALSAAFDRGARQLVVLGAGLDTYAYRGPLRDRLRIFEIDHPATQHWKRERLASIGVQMPASLTFVPVDFETQTLAAALAAAGFDVQTHSFFTWLGVVPYLSDPAIWSTLRFVAALRGGGEIVFDYGEPRESLSPEVRAQHDRRAGHLAALGEAPITTFVPTELEDRLHATGYAVVEDLGPADIAARYFGLTLTARGGGHVLRAATIGPSQAGAR